MSSNTPETTDESTHTTGTTRRNVLTGAAVGGAALLSGPASARLVEIGTQITETSELEDRLAALRANAQKQQAHPDIDVLNYALTLEHLEYTFYREGLEEFSDEELMEAKLLDSFGETITMEVPKYLADIRENEEAHVDTISKTIQKLGGNPVPEGEYAFGYETPTQFLKLAQAFENTGVAAYKGTAPAIADNFTSPVEEEVGEVKTMEIPGQSRY